MSKYHTTQKAAKKSNSVVLAVPYCFLQHVLNYESPTAYNAGVNGWNFDLYLVNYKYSIVTGYRGMSNASTHELIDHPELREALKDLDVQSTGPELSNEERVEKLIKILEQHLPV